MLRVLFVTPYYPPAHLGGIERAIQRLAAALKRERPDMCASVLTTGYRFPPAWVPGIAATDRRDDVTVHRIRPRPRSILPLFPYYSCPVTYLSVVDMARVLRIERPDVVHMVGDGWVWAHLWLLALRSERTSAVFTPSFHTMTPNRQWLRLPNTLVCRYAERLTVLSRQEERGVRSAYHAPVGKLRLAPWGVDVPDDEPVSDARTDILVSKATSSYGLEQSISARAVFAKAPDPGATEPRDDPEVSHPGSMLVRGKADPTTFYDDGRERDLLCESLALGEAAGLDDRERRVTILCVGRIGAHKGQRWLLGAYAAARPTFRFPARLVLVGSDEGDAAALRSDAAVLGLAGEVELLGSVNDAALGRLYRQADLFALFSHFEAFGLVYFEALTRGVPVLTHAVGANTELLMSGAIVTPAFDRDAAAAALSRLVNNPELRRRLGAEGRDDVRRRFTWEATARRFLTVYEEAIDERRSHTPATS